MANNRLPPLSLSLQRVELYGYKSSSSKVRQSPVCRFEEVVDAVGLKGRIIIITDNSVDVFSQKQRGSSYLTLHFF